MNLKDFQQKLFESGKKFGFSDMEVFYTLNKSTSISVQNKTIKDYDIAETSGLSFRGKFKEKIGYSFVEKISEESIDFVLNDAIENAKIIELNDEEVLFDGSGNYEQIKKYSEVLENTPVSKLIDAAFEMEDIVLKEDSRIKQVLECNLSKTEYEVSIINTKGLNCYSKGCIVNAAAYVMANEGEQNTTGYSSDYTMKDFSDINLHNIAKKSASEAISKLGAKTLKSGKYPVIFRHDMAGVLFSAFITNLSGENIEKGLSKLKGKIGEKIAGNNINVFEDPLMDGVPGATTFDAEGSPARKIKLIENGKLLTFMHNRRTAKKAGEQSTGNAFKNNYRSAITVGPHNVYLKPGEKNLDDLIEKTEKGVLIIELQGTHSGINSISGDFSLYATGFLIEDGKLAYPVNQITVSGNVFELWNDIDDIGNDLMFKSNISAPSTKVRMLSISGD
ncbi:TldD/PmbA family protein [Lysinibacillus fusiformis]|uniref:TldD/PmbA family protein n=1 Tax=Lysinibacillus fusiformis TaxID=28031 RepID=UPI0019679EFD|nr:TldD/PmbA family protein [Lysinibacillus fusiformis]QSB08730.1 TldD/PmbA family protein [Lysinibacillus fusiformis]